MTEPVSLETSQALTVCFYAQLRRHGEADRALVEATAGLAERQDAMVPALYSRLRGQPLFSDKLDRELSNADIEFGLAEFERLLPQRAPVLTGAVAAPATLLRGSLKSEPAALSEKARLERQNALSEINNLCQEAADLSFNALSLGQAPRPYDGRCPFRGLAAFKLADREFLRP